MPLSASGELHFYKAKKAEQPLALRGLMEGETGFQSPADDYLEVELDLSSYLIQYPEACYYARVQSGSFDGEGFYKSDILLIDKSLEPCHGRYVVVWLDGNYTIRRISQKNGELQLLPVNADGKVVSLREGGEVEIWGIIKAVIRELA